MVAVLHRDFAQATDVAMTAGSMQHLLCLK